MYLSWDAKLFVAKITSVLISVCVFFMGLSYGEEPNKVEFGYEMLSEGTVFEAGDDVTIRLTATNKGRPFEIDDYDEIMVVFYQNVDGENIQLDFDRFDTDDVKPPVPKLFRNGDTKSYLFYGIINDYFYDAVPGTYDMKVFFHGCSQVFEDVITVK